MVASLGRWLACQKNAITGGDTVGGADMADRLSDHWAMSFVDQKMRSGAQQAADT